MAGPSPSLGHGTATKNGSVDDQKDVSTAYLESLINDWLIKAQVAFDTQNLDELLQIIDDQGYWRDVELFLKKKMTITLFDMFYNLNPVFFSSQTNTKRINSRFLPLISTSIH